MTPKFHIQVFFAVKGRDNLVSNIWNKALHKQIAGIIEGKGQKSIIVNGMPDHVHLFIGLRPAIAIPALVRNIKNNASNFINDHNWVKVSFHGKKFTVHFLILIFILI